MRRGRKPVTTKPSGRPDTRPDLVERKVIAEHPHQLWVADITYVRSLTGFCSVGFITDVCPRRIVGWAISASLHTAGLDAVGPGVCACQHESKPWQAGPGPPLPIGGLST